MHQGLQTTKPDVQRWTREPMAWLACLVDAVPLAVVLVALLGWARGGVPAPVGLALYIGVFTALVAAMKPWRTA